MVNKGENLLSASEETLRCNQSRARHKIKRKTNMDVFGYFSFISLLHEITFRDAMYSA